MTNKNTHDANLQAHEELQNQYLEEAVDGLHDVIEKELKPKLKANYLPSSWAYEEQRVNRIVDGLRVNVEAEMQNSTRGQKRFYEEDDLSNFMSDSAVQKARAMQDSPYFARIDYIENGHRLGKTCYVSHYNFATDVISWRDPLIELYYKKNFDAKLFIQGKELQLERYRYIDIERGKLVQLRPEQTNLEEVDELLVERLTQKRGDEMRQLVETLQAEQYELISLPIEHPIVVQGSAGSGKSVIALHRLSYLLYNYPQLQAKRVVMIGPNKLFLKHVENVLTELGEPDVVQTTMQLYLEERMPLRANVQEVDRLILSEIHDLSKNEGKEQALEQFKMYTTMRQIKGSLSFKAYVEQYTKYITANLAPFLQTLTIGNYSVSGLELALFMSNEPHYGNSRARLKQFAEATIKNKAQTVVHIYQEIGSILEREVAHFLQLMQHEGLLQLSHPAIDWRLAQMQALQKQREALKTEETETLLHLFIADEQQKLARMTDENKRLKKIQDLAYEKASMLTHELHAAKNELKIAAQNFMKLKVEAFQQQAAELIVLREEAQHALAEQLTRYCTLFYEQEAKEQATKRAQWADYVTTDELHQHIEQLPSSFMSSDWAPKKEQLLKTLEKKIDAELQRIVTLQLEQLITRHFAAEEIVLKTTDTPSYLVEQQVLQWNELDGQIDALYVVYVDDVYNEILQDRYHYAATIQQDWDPEILRQFDILEKHDLAALHTIYQLIYPTTEKPFQYMIVDEAQDYTVFDLAVLHDLTEQIMLMGDLGQNLTPSHALQSWQQFEVVLGAFNYYELRATYRSTKQIVDFANSIIEGFSKDKYNLPELTFRNGAKVNNQVYSGELIFQKVRELVDQFVTAGDVQSKMAIIAKTTREATYLYERLQHLHVQLQIGSEYKKARVIITTPVHAKGLEFDTVILFRFSRFSKTDEHDTKLAYVAASRALHMLHVFS